MPVTAPPKTTAVEDPLHTVWSATGSTVGIGFTVIVNDLAVPGQPFLTGVTVMVATVGMVPVLLAVNETISPVPLAAKPMEVLSFAQLYVVPLTAPVKAIAEVEALAHTVWLDTVFTVGIGLTVIVNVFTVPVQPLLVGVTVMVATDAVAPELVAVNAAISPVPLAARPVVMLSLVQW